MPKETLKTVMSDAFGFSTLMEDAIGLNVDAFQTIWVLFLKPINYFNAAKDKYWENKFRPSIRIWFAISALTAALQFLWAGKNTPMHDLYTLLMEQIAAQLLETGTKSGRVLDITTFDAGFAATTLLKWYQVFLPFILILFIALLALIFNAWGQKLNYVAKVRYLFAVLIPASFFALVVGIFNKILAGPLFQMFMNISLFAMFLLYFITAYRGAYANVGLSKSAKFGRSLLLATLLMAAILLATFISIMIALYPTLQIAFEPHLIMPAEAS